MFSKHDLSFPKKSFNFVIQNLQKKMKNAIFKRWEHSCLNSKQLPNRVFKMLPMTNFCFDQFSKHSIVSKIFEKVKIWYFLTVRTLIYDLKLASKQVSKMLLILQKIVSTLSLKNLQKRKIISLMNPKNICFSPQGNKHQNYLLNYLFKRILNLNRLKEFASPSQEVASTSSIKNL